MSNGLNDGSPRCVACGGVWHPSSGDWDRRFETATCGPCHRGFRDWFKRHAKRLWLIRDKATEVKDARGKVVHPGKVVAKLNFYEEAVTSVRPPSVIERGDE